jgi:hypothetical protein
MNRPEWTVPDYDIVMSYWVRNLEDMAGLTSDPEWVALEKDAVRLSNPSLGHFVVGHEVELFDETLQNSNTPV